MPASIFSKAKCMVTGEVSKHAQYTIKLDANNEFMDRLENQLSAQLEKDAGLLAAFKVRYRDIDNFQEAHDHLLRCEAMSSDEISKMELHKQYTSSYETYYIPFKYYVI